MFMMVTLNTLPSQVEQLCGQDLAQLDGAREQGSSCGTGGPAVASTVESTWVSVLVGLAGLQSLGVAKVRT